MDHIINEVEALAERLIAIGDLQSFREVFSTDDYGFDVRSLDDESLIFVYDNYCTED